jgi:hypothetical protein
VLCDIYGIDSIPRGPLADRKAAAGYLLQPEHPNEAFSYINLRVLVCVGFTPGSASSKWKPSAESWI